MPSGPDRKALNLVLFQQCEAAALVITALPCHGCARSWGTAECHYQFITTHHSFGQPVHPRRHEYLLWQRRQKQQQPEPPLSLEPEAAPIAAGSFPDGIKVLHDCDDPVLDICFVHGLTGDRDSTWTAPGQPVPWPKALLAPRLKNARILAYGYDADVIRKSVAGTNRLIDHANNLIIDLATERGSSSAMSRPLVFVVHGLGGLVCKKATLLSRNDPEPHFRDVFDSLRALFSWAPRIGVPGWQLLAKIPARTIGIVKSTNWSLLSTLRRSDQFLESVHKEFQDVLQEQKTCGRDTGVACFFEQLPPSMAGVVVPKESAPLDGYTSVSIHANHRGMVKFESENHNGFKRLLGVLTRWESQIGKGTDHLDST